MYSLDISPRAKLQFKKFPKRYKEAIKEAIKAIREEPFSGKPLTRELTGKFAYKVGVYRIIYRVNKKDKIIQIITSGHRSTVYE